MLGRAVYKQHSSLSWPYKEDANGRIACLAIPGRYCAQPA